MLVLIVLMLNNWVHLDVPRLNVLVELVKIPWHRVVAGDIQTGVVRPAS